MFGRKKLKSFTPKAVVVEIFIASPETIANQLMGLTLATLPVFCVSP